MTEEKERAHKRAEIARLLSEPMPPEALKDENSRGFTLTSIKAGFVVERLNLIFGLLGHGWRYAHSAHHLEQAGGKEEVLVEIALQWRIGDPTDETYCPPVHWGQTVAPEGVVATGWYFRPDPKVWSEPVFTTGGASTKRKGSVPLTDAFRAAVTNGITKAAARLGVGNEVFKGQNDAPVTDKKATAKRPKRPTTPKATAKAEVIGFQTLTGISAGAIVAVAKLEVEGEADARTLQSLAHKMDALGLKMQAPRLLTVLLGKGEFSQARVMGIYNFLLSAKLTAENIKVINAAAWADSKKDGGKK